MPYLDLQSVWSVYIMTINQQILYKSDAEIKLHILIHLLARFI
jgi:hypothetical protein